MLETPFTLVSWAATSSVDSFSLVFSEGFFFLLLLVVVSAIRAYNTKYVLKRELLLCAFLRSELWIY